MAGRYIDIIVRVDTRQFARAMKQMGYEADAASAQTQRAFARTHAKLSAVGAAAVSTGRLMTGVGLAMGAVGYVAVKSAATFEQAMTRIQTQAGASAGQVDSLSKAVLNLGASGQVQYGPTQLANALFHIESVATGAYTELRKTSTAMMVLKVAAQGAALGGSDLEQTTTALMGALFATRSPLSQAGHMMGLLNATVGAGNMRMDDLVQALGRGVIPAFQQVGLTATDAFAAIALLSDSGVKASSGAAQLATALHFLVQPSTKADKFLKLVNMDSTQMAVDLHKPHGLLVALKDLATHLSNYAGGLNTVGAGQVLASIFPGGRGRIMLSILQNLDRYKGKIDAIYVSDKKAKEAKEAQARTISGRFHTAWAQINTDFTRFGLSIAPIVEKYLPKFLTDVTAIFKWLNGLSPATKNWLLKLTAGFLIGGPLMIGLGKFLGLLGKIWRAWTLIRGAAIAAGAAEAAAGAAGAAGGAAGAAGAAARTAAGASAVQAAVEGAGAGAAGAAGLSRLALLSRLGIAGIVVGGSAYLLNRFGTPDRRAHKVTGVGGHQYYNPRVAPYTHAAGGLLTGPPGTDNINGWFSAGEGLVTRAGMSRLGVSGLNAINNGTGGDRPIVIHANLVVDGRVLARTVLQETLRKAARGPSGLVGGSLATGAPALGR